MTAKITQIRRFESTGTNSSSCIPRRSLATKDPLSSHCTFASRCAEKGTAASGISSGSSIVSTAATAAGAVDEVEGAIDADAAGATTEAFADVGRSAGDEDEDAAAARL